MKHLTLDFFKEKKDKTLRLLEEYLLVLDDMQSNEKRKIQELKTELMNDKFQIVVVGEFSRGKSTFINALLGRRLLPSSAKPTTAILNIISYHPEPSINIYFHDKSKPKMTLTETEFRQLVAPKDPIIGDPESEREYEKQIEFLQSIRYAQIGYPIDICQDWIEIIDTPGTNDLDPMREQITNNIIPKSDAAILLLSATKILSESELSFLKHRLLENDIHKIFIVINFKDLLKTEEDMKKVMNYAMENLKPILKEPKIFMVAAKEALNAKRKANGEELVTRRGPIAVWDYERTGFIEFEKALSHFLQYERGAVKLQRPIQRMIKSIDVVIEKQISFERGVLNTKKDDLSEKADSIMKQIEHLEHIGQMALHDISFQLQKESSSLMQWYKKELQTIYSDALKIFNENQYLSIDALKRKIEDFLGSQERNLHLQKLQKIKTTIGDIIDKSSQHVNREWAKIDLNMDQLWKNNNDVTLPSTIIDHDIQSNPNLFSGILEELEEAWWREDSLFGKLLIGVGLAVTAILTGIGYVLGWLFGENEKVKMRRKLTQQFEQKQREKEVAFKGEWGALSKMVQNKYEQILQEQISKFKLQLQQAIDSTKLEEAEIQTRLEKIARWENKLNFIKTSLQSLYHELENTKTAEEYV